MLARETETVGMPVSVTCGNPEPLVVEAVGRNEAPLTELRWRMTRRL